MNWASVAAQSGTSTADENSAALPEFSVTAEASVDEPVSTEGGYFEFTLDAGKSAEAAVGIINSDQERDVFVQLNAVDAVTSQGGGAAYTDTGVEVVQSGTWLSVTADTVTVPAAKAGLVMFTITVPEDTPPGEYLAGISIWHDIDAHEAFENAAAGTAEATGGTQAGVRIRARYVLPVQVNVPGEWTADVEVTNASVLVRPSGAWVIVELDNIGDVFLRPTGTFTLTDEASGEIVISEDLVIDTFVTGTTMELWFPLPEGSVPGTYEVALELTYGEEQTLTFNATVEAEEST